LQIQENVFLQYFLGYSSFTNEAPFVPSLFVEIRERLSLDILSSINDIIIAHSFEQTQEAAEKNSPVMAQSKVLKNENTVQAASETDDVLNSTVNEQEPNLPNKGKLLMDATVAPEYYFPNRP
jgi:hypothetical protein